MAPTRIVLACNEQGQWKTYRQSQWIGLVRDNPEAATWSRSYFDIQESDYRALLSEFPGHELGTDQAEAIRILENKGASPIAGPR